MLVRTATLDDARAITTLCCARVDRWQRLNAQGQVEDLPYEGLTIYERWLHGGAWMSLETAAIWLSHLLRGGGLPLVLVDAAQRISGYAELYTGDEPAPYGSHVYLDQWLIQPDTPDEAAAALMTAVMERARRAGRLLAAASAYDSDQAALYQKFGFAPLHTLQYVNVMAQMGVGFYKALPHPPADAAQIAGWGMPIGRITSARKQWEALWHAHWAAVPTIAARRIQRVKVNASGQDAFICFHEKLYDPRTAEVYCWTPKAPTQQLLVAIRDYAYQQGYRTLSMAVTDKVAAFIGADAEAAPGLLTIFAHDLSQE